jgi:hypothetical protein
MVPAWVADPSDRVARTIADDTKARRETIGERFTGTTLQPKHRC